MNVGFRCIAAARQAILHLMSVTTTPLGWQIGCPGVGPIRRCHRVCAPNKAFTK